MKKTCSKCGESKPLDQFNNRKSAKDGKRTQCRKCENAYSSEWKKKNPEKHVYFNMQSYKRLMLSDEYKKNKADYNRKKRKENPDLYKKISNRYVQKIKNTIYYKIRTICSNLLLRSSSKKSFALLGYSKEDLIKRIEFNFKDGMNWDNYGLWHIDHKKPVSRFLKQGINDTKIINALSNLQPLWAAENIKKGCRFEQYSDN